LLSSPSSPILFFEDYGVEGGGLALHLLMSAVLPIKPVESEPSKRLTNSEKTAFTVTHPLTDIIIGLCLGDLYLQRQKSGVNTCLHFKQGICHNEYIYHLYDLNQPSSRSKDLDEG
jgi:hypothetical protein